LDHIGRRPDRRRTDCFGRFGLTLLFATAVLTGCASGAAQDARVDEARDAGLPEQLAAEQATRTVQVYFSPTGTPAPEEPAPPGLGALAITFGFRPDGTPDGSYASVPAGVGTVYAAAKLSGLSAGQVVSATVEDAWGNEIANPAITIDPGAADRWLALPIGLPADVVPGEYGVFVFCGDQTLGSLAFGVSGVGTSAQLLPEPPANPQVRATLPPPGMSPAEVTPTATAAAAT
jgi:hypothetical protein